MVEHDRPNPDPTLLTTEQLHHEMQWVKEMIHSHIDAEKVQLNERKELFLDLLHKNDELMIERIDGVQRQMLLLSEAAKVAVAKSEAGYEKRFENVNEFRAQNLDQAAKFITAVESKALHKATDDKLIVLTERFNRRDGEHAGQDTTKSDLRANLTAGVGVMVGLISLFLFLTNLNSKVDRNTDARINQTTQQTR